MAFQAPFSPFSTNLNHGDGDMWSLNCLTRHEKTFLSEIKTISKFQKYEKNQKLRNPDAITRSRRFTLEMN